MVKNFIKNSIVFASLMLASTAAKAAPEVKNMTLDLTSSGEITVVAEDGETYSKLQTSDITMSGYAGASMKRGEINAFAIFSGVCNAALCGTPAFKDLHNETNSGSDFSLENLSFTFSTDQFPQGLSNNVQAANIFRACNDRRNSGQLGVPFTHNIKVTLGLDVSASDASSFVTGYENTDYAKSFNVPVRVRCQSLEMAEALPKPFSVEIRVTQMGATCPKKTEVRAIIKYRKPAIAKFRFRVDGKLSELHTIKARKIERRPNANAIPGGNYYLVERIKYYYLDPGNHKFRVEVRGGGKSIIKNVAITCPPFKMLSTWLKYDVANTLSCKKNVKEVATFQANRPGSAPFQIKTAGGLVVHSGTAIFKRQGMNYIAKVKRNLKMGAFDQDMMALLTTIPSANSGWVRLKIECLEFTGDFAFIDNTGTKCTRKGKALINFSMNLETNIHYSLDCTNGHFSGIAQAKPHNNGGFIATALVEFDIDKTTQANCALKSVSPGATKIHKLRGRKFKCIKRTDEGGPNDLMVDPRPQSDAPDETPGGPNGLVTEPPKCKAREKLVRGRCIPIVIDCKRGFTLIKGKCVKQPGLGEKCKSNEHRVRGKCVKKPTVSILCKKGYKKLGNKCVLKPCKRGFKRVGKNCQKIIKCKKGFKKLGNKCVLKPCKAGYKRVGKSCKKIIKCQKGFKKLGNKCVLKTCKAGYKRVGKSCQKIIKCQKGFKKLGNKCVPKPCKKGKIRVNGKCIKPAG